MPLSPAGRDETTMDALSRTGVLAIVRYRCGGDTAGALAAVADGGVGVAEVTVDTPGAWEVIEGAAQRPGLVVGAGTVTRASQVRRLAALGGRFVVSPGLDVDVVGTCLELGLEPLPGVATASEVMSARRAGARLFKLFPAGALGSRYLRELRGPFGSERFVPTGGVSLDTASEWVAAGAWAVALGSDLAGRQPPTNAAERAEIQARASRAVEVVAQARRAAAEGRG